MRADRGADTWVPAFERDRAKALEDSRHSYSLTPLHDVVRTWRLRLAATPAVDVWLVPRSCPREGAPVLTSRSRTKSPQALADLESGDRRLCPG
ncbi:DUF6247 family protein [Streptomyces sp. NPDC101166]|uniref:DUF6247 family protein n=1 Tax=Streptomyces sp. NPDC101166 TaxID=3366120 RepID=UPI00380706CC